MFCPLKFYNTQIYLYAQNSKNIRIDSRAIRNKIIIRTIRRVVKSDASDVYKVAQIFIYNKGYIICKACEKEENIGGGVQMKFLEKRREKGIHKGFECICIATARYTHFLFCSILFKAFVMQFLEF